MMDDDLRQLDGVLRDRAAEVPQVQDVPPTMVARARRRVARNAVVFVLGAAAIVVGASAGLATLGAQHGPGVAIPGDSGSSAPSTACAAPDLRAEASLGGAMGSVEGSIRMTNVGGATCTLSGRPTVSIFSSQGDEVALQVSASEPQWQADGAPEPAGWPVVSLHPDRRLPCASAGRTPVRNSRVRRLGSSTSGTAAEPWTCPARMPASCLPATGLPSRLRSRSDRSNPAPALEPTPGRRRNHLMRRIRASLVGATLAAIVVLAALPAVSTALQAAPPASCVRNQLGVRANGINGAAGTNPRGLGVHEPLHESLRSGWVPGPAALRSRRTSDAHDREAQPAAGAQPREAIAGRIRHVLHQLQRRTLRFARVPDVGGDPDHAPERGRVVVHPGPPRSVSRHRARLSGARRHPPRVAV